MWSNLEIVFALAAMLALGVVLGIAIEKFRRMTINQRLAGQLMATEDFETSQQRLERAYDEASSAAFELEQLEAKRRGFRQAD
jgi:hypothetical protein